MGNKLKSSGELASALICFILGKDYSSCISIIYDNYVSSTENISTVEKEYYLQDVFEEFSLIKIILQFDLFNQETETIMM